MGQPPCCARGFEQGFRLQRVLVLVLVLELVLVPVLGKRIDRYRHFSQYLPVGAAVPNRRLAISCVSVPGVVGNVGADGVSILNPQINQARLGL